MTTALIIGSAVAALLLAAVLAPRFQKKKSPPRAGGRVPLEVPVRLRLREREVEMMSADVSRGGMCVAGEGRLSAGQPIEMEFALPGHSTVAVHGVVRWVERGKAGLL